MKKKILLSILPFATFILIMFATDNVSDPYINSHIHHFAEEFLFVIFLIVYFYRLKFVRYISIVVIVVLIVRNIMFSLNLYEVEVSFNNNQIIDYTITIEFILMVAMYLIALWLPSKLFNRVLLFLVIVRYLDHSGRLPFPSLFNLIRGEYNGNDDMPTLRLVLYYMWDIIYLAFPFLMYFTLFDIKQDTN